MLTQRSNTYSYEEVTLMCTEEVIPIVMEVTLMVIEVMHMIIEVTPIVIEEEVNTIKFAK